jgi:hypothetical protein
MERLLILAVPKIKEWRLLYAKEGEKMSNSTLDFIVKKFNLNLALESPIGINQVNRTIMCETLNELNFKKGAEIGVAKGAYALLMCQKIPKVHLYAVDIWESYEGYFEYMKNIGTLYEVAKKNLEPYGCTLIKKFSLDAVKEFEDKSLDFVYIDAAHDFKNVVDDICAWTKKVKIGGIVFGHDYRRTVYNGGRQGGERGIHFIDVMDAVSAYCHTKGIKPWFVLENGIADPTFGKDCPGWFFIRQEGDRE